MQTLIIGAGVGGLMTALSLHAAGHTDIVIAERSSEFRGLGVGLNLLPHAARELDELGVLDRVAELGVEPETLAYYTRRGQLIWEEPRGTRAGYRWPQLSVHRGKLQLLLRDLVTERLGDVIRLGHRLVEVAEDGRRATFETADGERTLAAELIVAADGIHSAARAQRYPEEGAPVWSGLTLWRGTAIVDPILGGRTMFMMGDAEQKFVAYPLGAPLADGRQRINFIAERRVAGSPSADWNRQVERGPVAALFAGWETDWLDIPAIIASAEELLEYPMVDRDAIPRWTFGRMTLLGDAAHAMYPNGSNGGSQATLDARTLVHAIGAAPDPDLDSALATYEAARRPATARLLDMTRQTGPERVMQLARERAPEGFAHIHDVIPEAELEAIAADYKRAAGFDPAKLNERTSLSVEPRA
ncbi:flavin-dependent oxidoreductase [Leucobacter chromiireducens]|uniref:Flavin-dependent oxidoreductase n=1 Tax=Leucobacter chromiireducens subsp. chromiireducens TaxID=660067 RepID=A0ABS1SP74_9MICO|nr:flavin-dependent oxidoreductase [Leucobacter chromiireducens]MBL3689977.1 flavin-dependent oxidoreductase [Leucobacter chromiireducens subsp. chromiireducens]